MVLFYCGWWATAVLMIGCVDDVVSRGGRFVVAVSCCVNFCAVFGEFVYRLYGNPYGVGFLGCICVLPNFWWGRGSDWHPIGLFCYSSVMTVGL